MIRIFEELNETETTTEGLTKDIISDVLRLHGFKSVISSDANMMNFTKIEGRLNNSKIDLTVYYDDSNHTCSFSLSSPDILDYAYLSDYLLKKSDVVKWANTDYFVVVDEMKERI